MLRRYFVLDPELGQLQYFINEQSKNLKPRGSLPLIGSLVAPCDEFPFMFTVYAANGDLFKLRGEPYRGTYAILIHCFWFEQAFYLARFDALPFPFNLNPSRSLQCLMRLTSRLLRKFLFDFGRPLGCALLSVL